VFDQVFDVEGHGVGANDDGVVDVEECGDFLGLGHLVAKIAFILK